MCIALFGGLFMFSVADGNEGERETARLHLDCHHHLARVSLLPLPLTPSQHLPLITFLHLTPASPPHMRVLSPPFTRSHHHNTHVTSAFVFLLNLTPPCRELCPRVESLSALTTTITTITDTNTPSQHTHTHTHTQQVTCLFIAVFLN